MGKQGWPGEGPRGSCRGEWSGQKGGRPKEKPQGLTVGAGSGLAAVSGRVCLRAAGGVGSSAEAGGPRRVPHLHRPPEQSYEVLAFSKIVKN